MGTEFHYQTEPLDQWSTEVQILLLCGRCSLDDDQIQRVRACVEREIDWERLIYLARGHGLVSLLHKNLELACPNEVPRPYRERLSADAMKISARNVLLATELLGLLNLFEASGISVMPYKGPALAIQAYRDLRLRGFIDLDILIRRNDLDRVRDLIATLGYKPQIEITAAKQRAIFRSECDQVFTRSDGKIILEVHWAITPPFFSFALDADELFARNVRMDLLGKNVLALSPEDLLLILCVNGTKDIWRRLEISCCVAELLRDNPQLRWTEMLEEARRLGAERMLLLGLYLARDLFQASLPQVVTDRLDRLPKLQTMAQKVYRLMFDNPEQQPTLFELTMFRLHCRERLRDRLNYCIRRILTPTY
ncbi:MAG: hypothetical protein AUI36_16785, partial [Cyanobacteria bacterium 13_1_40CM_2_61_4]